MLTTPVHVLVTDDEAAIRGLIARVVARTFPAVTITAVGDGQAALNVYLQHGADVIITNNDMPMLSGIELVRAVRAQTSTLPIVMVSGDVSLEAAALAAGVTAFVRKPFTIAELAQVLRRVLLQP